MDKIKAAKFDTMNYEELELFEEVVGFIPATDEELERLPKAKLMVALGYISAKRENPDVTLADVRALPIGAIVFNEEDEDAEGNDSDGSNVSDVS